MGVAVPLNEKLEAAEEAYRFFATYTPRTSFPRENFYQKFLTNPEFQRRSLGAMALMDRLESRECESETTYVKLCFKFRDMVQCLND